MTASVSRPSSNGTGGNLTVQETKAIARTPTVESIKARADMILDAQKKLMKPKIHYGSVGGINKPTLLKAGAEVLKMMFQIANKHIVEDRSTEDEAVFIVTSEGYNQVTGDLLGSGVGMASSNEEKYKWRRAICEQEWNEAPEDRRREVWKKYDKNEPAKKIKQVRTQKADVQNTVLKIAAKRADVAMVLNVTAASDVFTQDLEDLPAENLRNDSGNEGSAAAPHGPKEDQYWLKNQLVAKVAKYSKKSAAGKNYVKVIVTLNDGTTLSTLKEEWMKPLMEAWETKTKWDFLVKDTSYSDKDLVTAKQSVIATAAPASATPAPAEVVGDPDPEPGEGAAEVENFPF